jgi:hypothetical protein
MLQINQLMAPRIKIIFQINNIKNHKLIILNNKIFRIYQQIHL